MTIESQYAIGHGRSYDGLDDDILAALWEVAPFPRLPFDAPQEIKELVVDIENPKRVYTIHRASRRHNLQVLIDKFIVQLRYGCGSPLCPTTSCFTYRKRLAGKAPIRRYNPSSARTLAVFLASQDNPENRLCPHLQLPKKPSDPIKPHVKSSMCAPPTAESHKPRIKPVARSSTTPETSPLRRSPSHSHPPSDHDGSPNRTPTQPDPPSSLDAARLRVAELEQGGTKKDHRSFAANVFGTVALKMFEWLTPVTIESLSRIKEEEVGEDDEDAGQPQTEESRTSLSSEDEHEKSAQLTPTTTLDHTSGRPNPDEKPVDPHVQDHPDESKSRFEENTMSECNGVFERPPAAVNRLPQPRRKSNTKIRTSSGVKPTSKVVVESLAEPTETIFLGSPDKISKALALSPQSRRSVSQPLSEDITETTKLDHLSDQPEPPPLTANGRVQTDGTEDEDASGNWGGSSSSETKVSEKFLTADTHNDTPLEPASELDHYLPQSLSRLSLEAVNFICDVLQEDVTAERHLLRPPVINGSLQHSSGRHKSWRRKRNTRASYPHDLKYQWKLFAEQSIFSALSDPQAMLASFTGRDGSVDSQTLWYCMLRLTRAAPRLVFDSLWNALASLFAPPRALQSTGPQGAKVFATTQRALSNVEAASLMCICFHALVAAAPLVMDSRQIDEISRIRSHGLLLTNSGTTGRQLTSLCLEYEDIFTDDLALRLARRLLTAITTRRYFDELIQLDLDPTDNNIEADVLDIMLSQMEPSMQSLLNFSKAERTTHEKRVPVLLLDWARAVMIQDWSGKPDVPGDGPFGGALMLIGAMYRKRQSLLLGDGHFRSEYFSDRLDLIEMPVSWLSFTSTRQRAHLLDYPYIFNPASLVSYFRAINLSRMSRAYEESSSLEGRIRAIIGPGSLVTDIHQRDVLEDLLKTPAAKYLVLSIARDDVLGDAFEQLWRREERELLRPLKIRLGEDGGEEGFDSGGVQQEFFRMAIAEALNPDYGAFTVDDRTRMTWFQPGAVQPDWRYEMIGLLVSLAVYNGLTLPITFPRALYHKLLGEPVTELHHIADGWPEFASGLTNLLEWNEADGDVEDVFVLTYEFSASIFEQPVSRQMETHRRGSWPQLSARGDGEPLSAGNPTDAPPVTGDNREQYVKDYIRYLTDVSIAPQFEAFARGFRACLQPKSLTLLTPTLLQSLVEGNQEIDIGELRRCARYVGWDASHRSVSDFWSIVKEYDEDMRRKLLEFVTASDRVPVGGTANVQFVIQRNGEEGEGGHLPTAYTCYGTLLLPEYPNREVLKERMGMALQNARGFGFA
ncbi:hypothetical protein F5Y16DRAFT_29293 [Xylariaceae sp. FL0255]|nr:hypothetical protein F5Y16DRAFT_29293 [Xylariaceae sp. FL0255]